MSCGTNTNMVDENTIVEFRISAIKGMIQTQKSACEKVIANLIEQNEKSVQTAADSYSEWLKKVEKHLAEYHSEMVRRVVASFDRNTRKIYQKKFPLVDFDTAKGCWIEGTGIEYSDWWKTLVSCYSDPINAMSIANWMETVKGIPIVPWKVNTKSLNVFTIKGSNSIITAIQWLDSRSMLLDAVDSEVITDAQFEWIGLITLCDKDIITKEVDVRTLIKK